MPDGLIGVAISAASASEALEKISFAEGLGISAAWLTSGGGGGEAVAVPTAAADVTDTLELALQVSGCDQATVMHKPRLLSDNGSSYISGDRADWLDDHGMGHVRGAPYHPQTQGKIERWHQTLKNRILLENYYLPGDLENQIGAFVDHYNNQRYHESIGNVTPADAYFGRHTAIIERRKKIKKLTIQNRRLNHQRKAA